jgi:hypothetical protein
MTNLSTGRWYSLSGNKYHSFKNKNMAWFEKLQVVYLYYQFA